MLAFQDYVANIAANCRVSRAEAANVYFRELCSYAPGRAQNAERLLAQSFGRSGFRPGQREVIDLLLSGRSVVGVLPPGGGTALCHQLPAVAFGGLTLAICPQVMTMRGQVDFLRSRGIEAACLDSTLTREQRADIFESMRSGRLRILYVTPEGICNEMFSAAIRAIPIKLLAIDSAESISQLSHNFRPEYRAVVRLAFDIATERVLAMTTAATPAVAEDVARELAIPSTGIVRVPWHRSHVMLESTAITDGDVDETLLRRLQERPIGPTVCFVRDHQTAERVAGVLQAEGFLAWQYHHRMTRPEREAIEREFRESDRAIVVATAVLGKSLHKDDIRYVYHLGLPPSVETYYQQIGLAGRDGDPATCEVLYCPERASGQANCADHQLPARAEVEEHVRRIPDGAENRLTFAWNEFHRGSGALLKMILVHLEMAGHLISEGTSYCRYDCRQLRPRQEMHLMRKDAPLLDQLFPEGRSLSGIIMPDELALQHDVPRDRVVAILMALQDRGDIELQGSETQYQYRRVGRRGNIEALTDLVMGRLEDAERRRMARMREMIDLVTTRDCITKQVAAYFGDEQAAPCGQCQRCRTRREIAEGPTPARATSV